MNQSMQNPNQPSGGGNMIPSVLIQNSAVNESQDSILNTVRLQPNSFSNNTSVFVIPKSGTVLDHNSSLVWSVSWDGYANGDVDAQRVALKQFSGALNTLQRARMYVGGRLLFTNQDVGQTVHIDKMSNNPDHLVEVEDVKLGSQHSYRFVADGKVEVGSDVSTASQAYNRLTRALGSYSDIATDNKSFEATLLLHDIFPALKGGIQLPVKFLKEEVRIEVDFVTAFDSVALCTNVGGGLANTNISIRNPILYLDYLSYDPVVEAGIMESMAEGISIPYREISYIQKQLPPNTNAPFSSDILLGFQGKLLMKIYVSHRFPSSIAGLNFGTGAAGGVTVTGYERLNGRCRSNRGLNMAYNLIVNDIFIHDQNVDTASQAYNYLSMTKQNPIYVYPNSYDTNRVWNVGVAAGDFNDPQIRIGGLARADGTITAAAARDGFAGCQSYIGFDLSKYGPEGGINPANSGFRVGSTPIILRLDQNGGAANTPQGGAKAVDVFCESVKVMQIRNGMVDTIDA